MEKLIALAILAEVLKDLQSEGEKPEGLEAFGDSYYVRGYCANKEGWIDLFPNKSDFNTLGEFKDPNAVNLWIQRIHPLIGLKEYKVEKGSELEKTVGTYKSLGHTILPKVF